MILLMGCGGTTNQEKSNPNLSAESSQKISNTKIVPKTKYDKSLIKLEDNDPEVIIIGSGGGISGTYTNYEISNDGGVKKITLPANDVIHLNDIHPNELNLLYSDYRNLDKSLASDDTPNFALYIGHRKNGEEKLIRWAANQKTPGEGYDDFFNFANDIIKE